VPTIRALTTALKRLHFRYGAIRGVRGWYVKRTAASCVTKKISD